MSLLNTKFCVYGEAPQGQTKMTEEFLDEQSPDVPERMTMFHLNPH